MYRGRRVSRKPLYLPLNFVVNLYLLLKKKILKKVKINELMLKKKTSWQYSLFQA